jgi:hypothetical protein
MTTSDASDKVRVQCIEGSSFWRSGNQGPRKGKGGSWFLKGVKLIKLDWLTKKAVARHMTRGATDAERQRLPKTASYVPESRVVR